MKNFLGVIAAKSSNFDKSEWLSLMVHANDTAGIIRKLYASWLPERVRNEISKSLSTDAEKFCELVALLHDIGKITPSFQNMIAKNIENHESRLYDLGLDISGKFRDSFKSPHKLAGYVILRKMSRVKIPDEIAVIIAFHHGRHDLSKYDEQIDSYHKNYFGKNKKLWQELWNEWISYAIEKTGFTPETLPRPDVQAQMILTGLLIMADWIASNTHYFPYVNINEIPEKINIKERVNHAWETLGLPKILEIENVCDDPEKFLEKFSFAPNSMQREVIEIISKNPKPGLYILEAPMGLGKTEAALAAAEILINSTGAGGIYFGLPTQATANGIFGRIADWASKCDPELHSIRLAHGMTELNEEYRAMFHGNASEINFDSQDDSENFMDNNIIVHEWFEGRKQALLADFVTGTIDQFLLASLKQKHVMLRHLGLAGKIVILDECHAYDAYMNVYLDHALTWMGAYGVSVIVLSATLPPKRRDELIMAYSNSCDNNFDAKNAYSYPVLTSITENGGATVRYALSCDVPDKRILIENLDEENLADYLREKLSGGGCAAVIANSVAYAQEISKMLENELKNFNFRIICFHGRFIATDRAKIESSLLKSVGKNSKPDDRDKLIVVGTQVIEQSLDLDFDLMVTELCPMDLLLQRSGRLHRHKGRERHESCEKPILAILRPVKPRHSVYDEWILQQTEKYLPDVIVLPSGIPELVSKVYETPEGCESNEAYEKYCFNNTKRQDNAEKYCIKSNMLGMNNKNLITKFLDDDAGNSLDAEASVRDSIGGIEVIALQKKSQNSYGPISSETSFDITSELNSDEAILIARERLRLPAFFENEHDINALNKIPKRWKKSKLLKNELALIFDENSDSEINGKKLRYDRKFGLIISDRT